MENTSHSFDDDFNKINILFNDYAKSVNYENVDDFKSAKKTQLTNQVWKTLYKVPKNRKLMEENAADFVDALNDCIKACLNKIQTGIMNGSFSQYIYNTIPGRLSSAAHKEQSKNERIVYSKEKTQKIRDVAYWYEYLEKCGTTDHNKIIKKIAILKNMSETDVEKYYKLNKRNKTSIYQHNSASESSYDVLSSEAGKKDDISTPENDYVNLEQITSVFAALDNNWKNLKPKKTEDENTFTNRKTMLSELLTVYILKEYQVSFERKANLASVAVNIIDFDISEAFNKYSFLNKPLVENFIKSEDRKLPTQNEIAAKYFSEMKKDAVTHMRDRFIEKAVEKLK